MYLRFSIKELLLITAACAIGLSAGLYWAKGPAWVFYYQSGYADGFEAGSQPMQRLERRLSAFGYRAEEVIKLAEEIALDEKSK